MVYSSRVAIGTLAALFACCYPANAKPHGHFLLEGRAVFQVDITPQTIEQIAIAGEMDLECVKAANPDKDDLKVGDTVLVPLACCEGSGSCNAPFCIQRDACAAVPGEGVVTAPIEAPAATITGTVTSTTDPGVIVPPPGPTDPPPPPPVEEVPPPPPAEEVPPPPPAEEVPPPPPAEEVPPPPPAEEVPPPPPAEEVPPPPPAEEVPPPPPTEEVPPPPPAEEVPPPPPTEEVPPPPPAEEVPPPPPAEEVPPPPPAEEVPPPPNPTGLPPPPPADPTGSCQLPAAGSRRFRNRQDNSNQQLCPEEGEDPDPTGKPYLIGSVKGTSNETFQAFLLLPPLANRKGDLISFSDVPWQSYQVLDLSDADAAIIRANPLISFVEPITEDDGESRSIPRHVPSTLRKRSLPSALNVRENSPFHLGLLTARNQRLNPSVLPDYVFEPSLGKGQTIYVIDSGYLPIHVDFDATEREVRDVTAPNRFTLDPLNIPFADQAPQDNTDFTGHGTAVASIAAGKLRGVASKANLVVVKFKNAALNPNKPDSIAPRGVLDGALEFALDFVISDVARLKRANNNDPNKKFVVNLSYGWPEDTAKGKTAILERALPELWAMDVVVVICSASTAERDFLDELTPQFLGQTNNELIIVGGVNREGLDFDANVRSRDNKGEVNLYAGAVDVTAASHNQALDSTTLVQGTSFAAPAVAGLAAYFFGIPELQGNFRAGSIATDIKQFMIKNSEVRNENPGGPMPADSMKVPYNLALNELCGITDPATKRSILILRDLEDDSVGKPIVTGGNVVDEALKKTVCDTTNGAANGGDPPPEQTVLPEAPTPSPTQLPPAPVETPPPAPQSPTQIYEVGSFGSIFAIFNHDKGQSINVCEAGEPLLRGPELPDNLLDLTDPVTLGPFDLPGSFTACNFVANDPNAGGDILCNAQPKIPCARKPLSSVGLCLGNDNTYQQIWVCNE